MTTSLRASVRLLGLLVSISLLLAGPLRAQEVAPSFEEMRRLVAPGDTIYVTDVGGVTIKGKLAGLSASSLELRVGRDALALPLGLSERDVNNIVLERSDSLWNGTLIGLAVGAVPVALIDLFAGRSEYGPAVPRDAPRYKEPFDPAPILGAGGIGLVTGLLIDVFNKERITIYVHAQAVGAAAEALDDTATGNDPILLAPSRGRVSPASTASSFTELRVLVKPGQTVSVTDASGRQIGGRIVELSPAAVAVMVQGARLDFAESEVRQMERLGDPLWNGAVIGLGVGAGVGFVAGAIGVREDPRGFPSDVLGAIARGAILLAGITIGTATGLVIDALHKQRKLVYLTAKSREQQGETRGSGSPAGALITARAVSKQRTGVSVSPLLGKDRRGVLVSVGF